MAGLLWIFLLKDSELDITVLKNEAECFRNIFHRVNGKGVDFFQAFRVRVWNDTPGKTELGNLIQPLFHLVDGTKFSSQADLSDYGEICFQRNVSEAGGNSQDYAKIDGGFVQPDTADDIDISVLVLQVESHAFF